MHDDVIEPNQERSSSVEERLSIDNRRTNQTSSTSATSRDRKRRHRSRRRRKRVARALFTSASLIGPILLILCLLLAFVTLVKWPDGTVVGGRSTLLEKYMRQRDFARIERLVGAGDAEGAAVAWRQTLVKEQNNITTLRRFFEHDERLGGALTDKIPGREQRVGLIVTLGGTNREDLQWVMKMRARRCEWEQVLVVAGKLGSNLTTEARGLVARAYLALGDVLAFDQEWSESSAAFEVDATLKPWRLAANALLRESADAARAKSDLTAMLAADKASDDVADALLFLAFQAGDTEGHRSLLHARRIIGRRALNHWMDHVELLARVGDMGRIDDIVDGLPLDRADQEEIDKVAKRLMQLGLTKQVGRLVERRHRAGQSLGEAAVLAGFAALLDEEWERGKSLAARMQTQSSPDQDYSEISRFLLGGVALSAGEEDVAALSFDRMSVGSSQDPKWLLGLLSRGMRLSAGSLQAPCIRQAWLVARDLEGLIGTDGAYWRTRSELAGYAVQVPDMLFAARSAMQLDPGTASRAAMTGALLLAQDAKPEVLDLSASLMQATPVLAEWRILRARALVSCGRLAEGKAILKAIKPSTIPTILLPSLNVAWLEAHVSSQDWNAARKALDGLRSVRLEPLMRAKVDRLAASIPKT